MQVKGLVIGEKIIEKLEFEFLRYDFIISLILYGCCIYWAIRIVELYQLFIVGFLLDKTFYCLIGLINILLCVSV